MTSKLAYISMASLGQKLDMFLANKNDDATFKRVSMTSKLAYISMAPK